MQLRVSVAYRTRQLKLPAFLRLEKFETMRTPEKDAGNVIRDTDVSDPVQE